MEIQLASGGGTAQDYLDLPELFPAVSVVLET